MSILNRLFGGSDGEAATLDGPAPECAHGALVPRWDSAEDMGTVDRVAHYYCEGCGQQFSPAEAEAIRR